MDIHPTVSFICDAYEEISTISKRERIERFKDEKQQILYLPTLEHLNIWIDLHDWNTAPIYPDDFLRYITVFHSTTISEKLK